MERKNARQRVEEKLAELKKSRPYAPVRAAAGTDWTKTEQRLVRNLGPAQAAVVLRTLKGE